jgi:hypothetical protein
MFIGAEIRSYFNQSFRLVAQGPLNEAGPPASGTAQAVAADPRGTWIE